jgi:competence protein ComEA
MVLAVIAALVALVLFWKASPRPLDDGNAGEAARLGVPAATAEPTSASAVRLVVHVVGAVRKPGVVELSPGSRVSDAVEAAGGLRRGTDPASINLARPVADGEQVVVGVADERGPAGDAGGSTTARSSDGRVSLNAADPATLETLDGVGPVLAERIVQWRESNGGFRTIEDLRKVSGIGPKIFASLEDQVRL